MTMLDGALPKTKQQDRQSAANFLHWKFPDLKRLENLRTLQTEEREYLDSIERNGATGRVVECLRSMLDSREIESERSRRMAGSPRRKASFVVRRSRWEAL
jgi:hypothetical protein